MKIGIIFAMECEKEAFVKFENEVNCVHEYELFVSGIGKVNAAITATKAIVEAKCDYIINCGIAGGINGAKQFEVYQAAFLAYSDVDVTMFGYEYGQIPKLPATFPAKTLDINLPITNFSSQDSFATDKQKNMFSLKFSDYKTVDMESASIAHVCYILDKPFTCIRSISDEVFEPNNHLDFSVVEIKACEVAAKQLIKCLCHIS